MSFHSFLIQVLANTVGNLLAAFIWAMLEGW